MMKRIVITVIIILILSCCEAFAADIYYSCNNYSVPGEFEKGKLTAWAETSDKEASAGAVMFIAAYSNNELTGISMQKLDLSSGINGADMDISDNETTCVKLFLISEKLLPLAESVVLNPAKASETELDAPSEGGVLSLAIGAHPRIGFDACEAENIRESIANDGFAYGMYSRIKAKADSYLDDEPAKFALKETYRLSDETSAGIKKIPYLAFMYLMTSDESYAVRAYEEMDAVCSYPDWNEQHFLDTASILEAMALGYDWMYEYLCREGTAEKTEAAIISKGLSIGMKVYTGELTSPSNTVFWLDTTNNWNAACNSAMICAALALGEKYPDYAGVVSCGLASTENSLGELFKDGGWHEGVSYWNSIMSDYALLFASLDASLGTDFGYSDLSSFKKSLLFGTHMTGSGGVFNFSDCDETTAVITPALFWFAKKYADSTYALCEIKAINIKNTCDLFDLIWYEKPADDAPVLSKDSYFRNIETVGLRSGFEAGDIFVGFHSGDNSVSHTHLDTGTFVLDALGERWFSDIGRDRSSYTGTDRAKLYALRAEGHNTVVIHDSNPEIETDANGLNQIYSDDFEGNVFDYSTNVYSNASLDIAKEDDNSFVRIACHSADGKSKSFFQKGFESFAGGLNSKFSIDFDVRIMNSVSDIAPFTLRDSSGTEITSVIWLTQNQKVRVMNNGEKVDVATYTKGEWLKFTVDIDIKNSLCDVYMNGKLIAEGYTLTKKICDVSLIRFPVFWKIVTMDIDNLKIYADKTSEEIILARMREAEQSEFSNCHITEFISSGSFAYAATDMTDAYHRYADKATRKISLLNNRSEVLIEDEFELKCKSDFNWYAHTDADIALSADSKTAYLSKNSKQIRVVILSDTGTFSVLPASSDVWENKNATEGINKLAVVIENIEYVNLKIKVIPDETAQ